LPDQNDELYASSFHFDLSKHYPVTYYTLPLALWDLIQKNWAEEQVNFTEDYPRDSVKGPTIVWSIYRRIPGREGVEVNKPRLRATTSDPSNPTQQMQTYAQWMTIIYQFDIYHISNQEVDALTEKFDNFLFFSVPLLKQLGVSEWLFDEQLSDYDIEKLHQQNIYRRRLRYRCILEKIYNKPVPLVQQVWTQVGASMMNVVTMEQVTRGSLSPKDQLSKPWAASPVIYISRIPAVSGASEFVEDVDFKLDVSFPSGVSNIEWLPNGKHPAPGEVYYVTYNTVIMAYRSPSSP